MAVAIAVGLGFVALPATAAMAAGTTVTGTVYTGGGKLNTRTAPSTKSAKAGTVKHKAKVKITCQVTGQYLKGAVRSTSQWDKLTNGRYVSHAYIRSRSIPQCVTALTVDAAGSALSVRAGVSTASTAVGTVASGTTLAVVCQAAGQSIAGTVRTTALWDRLSNGAYVSHAYVRGTAATVPCAAPAAYSTEPVAGMSNQAFIAASVAGAQRSQLEYGVPASVTIAQAILESGWGRSQLTRNDRNFFGIKCFGGDPGPLGSGCHSYATYECLPTCAPTTATFRTYTSAVNSFRDHGRFLTVNSRYRPAYGYLTNSDRFIFEIWKAGYATSPTYYTNITALMRQYNLYRYDLR